MKRVRLRFAGMAIDFVDRGKAIQQVLEWVRGVVIQPFVVFGPEGCGKSAWLRQAAEVLREQGFDVIYVDVLHREYAVHTDVKEVVEKLSDVVADATGYPPVKLANLVIMLVKDLLRKWREKRVAVLVDEVFQAIGLDKAEIYVKMLLNLIEYPPADYEKIIAIAATSEGVSRWRIGRHRWAEITPIWNMPRKGFEELYEKVPGPKPSFDEVWRLTGGNPFTLEQLHQAKWDINRVTESITKSKGLTRDFVKKWRQHLIDVVDDPDALVEKEVPEELKAMLIEKNLVVYDLYSRNPELWVDEPPPERDPELGIGRHVAWQTPLHKEAVKRAIEKP